MSATIVNFHVFTFVVPCCDVRYNFRVKEDVIFVLTPLCFVGDSCFICFYVRWCPTRYTYKMMFVSSNSNMTGATSGARTAKPFRAHEFTPDF